MIRDLLKTRSVVCDRYIFSTQLCHAAMDERIRDLFEVTGLIMPDQVFILTAEEKVRNERLSQRGVATLLEKDFPFQRKVEKLFQALNYPVIDTTNTRVEDVVALITKTLRKESINV